MDDIFMGDPIAWLIFIFVSLAAGVVVYGVVYVLTLRLPEGGLLILLSGLVMGSGGATVFLAAVPEDHEQYHPLAMIIVFIPLIMGFQLARQKSQELQARREQSAGKESSSSDSRP